MEFFERKLNSFCNEQATFTSSIVNEKASLANYSVSSLVLPAAVEMVQIMVGDKEAAKLKIYF